MSESPKDPKAVSSPNEAAGWPGGWYIYEAGKVEGPYAAEDAFGRSAETGDGKPRLVSRKGFSQWYALKDLSEIFRMTENLGRQARGAVAELTETQILRFKADVGAGVAPDVAATAAVSTAALVAQPPPPAPMPRVRARQIDTSPSRQPAQVSMTEPPFSRPVLAGAAAELPYPRAPALQPQRPVKAGKPAKAAKPAKRPAATAAPRKATPDNAQLQEYFMVRSRLRLGKIRNPWISAFVGAPLSLGIYWGVWLAQMAREITWHTKQTQEKTTALGIMAMVPFFHFYALYQVAKQMRDMEVQNKYASVSPTVACLFGIFPPFALAYLQDAANRHWLLHVKYSIAKPKSPEGPLAAED